MRTCGKPTNEKRLICRKGKSTAIFYDTDDKRKTGSTEEGALNRERLDKIDGLSFNLHIFFIIVR